MRKEQLEIITLKELAESWATDYEVFQSKKSI